MIQKIMLIVPPNIVLKDSIRRIGEPLGPLMIATYLKSRGYAVDVYDMSLEGYDNCIEKDGFIVYGSSDSELIERLKWIKPDLVGISVMFSSRESLAIHVAEVVKAYDPSIPITVGGMQPTISPESYLKSFAVDYVIMHDGEMRLEKLISNLNALRSPEYELDGIAFRTADGMKIQPSESINQYFDTMLIPDRDLLDFNRYLEIGKPYAPYSGKRTAHVVASRGCPFNCVFCAAVNFVGHTVRLRNPELLIKEIEDVVSKYGVEEIQFMDDNLTFDKNYAMNLFKRLTPLGIRWCTPNGLFFNSLDEEMLETMRASGCYQITLAIESGSKRVLKEIIQKSVDLDKVKPMVAKAHELGMYVHGLFVVGLIGETMEELNETLRFPFKARFDSVSFSAANAFKGSKLYEQCRENGYIISEQESVNYRQTNFKIPTTSSYYTISPDELENLLDSTMQEFFEFSKEQFPHIYEEKYKQHLKSHEDDEEKIRHRL